jgi:hypothetical protein
MRPLDSAMAAFASESGVKSMRLARSFTLLLILCNPLAALGEAGGASAEIAALRAEIAALSARLDRLERGASPGFAASATSTAAPAAIAQGAPTQAELAPTQAELAPTQAAPAPGRAPDTAVLRFAGDMRYRHEVVDDDAFTERQRQRIRARFGVAADVTDGLRVGLTLATGGDDPVSANQTLEGGFERKSFGVDRAFFAWQATDALSITGGKMANPFFRAGNHHLIYDADLNPEGLALRYDRTNWFASFAGFWVEERSAADDSILLGGQLGYRAALGGGRRLTAGLSYYDYPQTQGEVPFWDGAAAGNRLDSAGRYRSDFNEAELFAQLDLEAGGRPLQLFADYVLNVEADDQDAGYAIGVGYGEVTKPGTWRVGYAYQRLEADAVVGTFTDSDWAGGGTDGRGHVVDFAYGFRPRWTLGFKYFVNERGIAAGEERDYDRLQADVSFNY